MRAELFTRPIRRELVATWGFVARNLHLTKRYWGWELVWFVYSLTSSLAVAYIGLGTQALAGPEVDGRALTLYLLVGTLVWAYLSQIFYVISEMVAWERWEGTIEYTFMAPSSRLTHLVGTSVFAVIYGIARTLLILAAAAAFFDIPLSGADLPAAGLWLLVGSVSFVGFGILAGVMPLLFPERGVQMTNVLAALLLLVSGVYYPVEVLPAWMQALAKASPATYVIQGMREAILSGQGLEYAARPLALLALGGGGMILLGAWVFSRAERYAKRTGRLKRSG
ncbi:ABC transporter permease [Candidatus Acetothermia bacterium]|nr:MAG: ABC transporter permease [Candidatus Acetothermia bacterium]